MGFFPLSLSPSSICIISSQAITKQIFLLKFPQVQGYGFEHVTSLIKQPSCKYAIIAHFLAINSDIMQSLQASIFRCCYFGDCCPIVIPALDPWLSGLLIRASENGRRSQPAEGDPSHGLPCSLAPEMTVYKQDLLDIKIAV